jgi:hypothetical protein
VAQHGKGTYEVGGSSFGLATGDAPPPSNFSVGAWPGVACSWQAGSTAATSACQASSRKAARVRSSTRSGYVAIRAKPRVGAVSDSGDAEIANGTSGPCGSPGTPHAARSGAPTGYRADRSSKL